MAVLKQSAAAGLFLFFALTAKSASADSQGLPPAPTQASAVAPSEFAELYARASEAYKAQHYVDAIKDLRAAYKLRPQPRLLFNIAQAYRRLADSAQARFFFTQYLEADTGISKEKRAETIGYINELSELALATPPSLNNAAAAPEIVVTTPAAVQPYAPLSYLPPMLADRYRVPRWLKATGALLIIGGAGLLTAGAVSMGLNGQCTHPPMPPALACTSIYALRVPGTAELGVGASLIVAGVISLSVAYGKEAASAHRSSP